LICWLSAINNKQVKMHMEKSFAIDYKWFNRNNIQRILSRYGEVHRLNLLYISTYIPNYTRTETLLSTLKEVGVNTTVVLLGNDKWKYFKAVLEVLRRQKDCDVIIVGFRGQEILPFIRLTTHKPIIFDAFFSIYDTLCFDRCVLRPDSMVGRLLKWYDGFLCSLCNVTLLDTNAYKEYFEREFGALNIEYLYVGCNDKMFRPFEFDRRGDFTVFWYGYANPLQGVDVILSAAKKLEGRRVSFKLVGPIREKYGALIEELKLSNVDFVDFVPYEDLPVEINRADICLGGHFSDKGKARRVIAGKSFQFVACNKRTIVGDNAANHEIFNEDSLVHFVKMNDADALAAKILELGG
jgi:glycosyltransferase involved in cell wall biosynthesis